MVGVGVGENVVVRVRMISSLSVDVYKTSGRTGDEEEKEKQRETVVGGKVLERFLKIGT